MRHTRARTIAAACALSGIPSIRAPRGGWRRDAPGDTGDPNPQGGGPGTGDTDPGKAGDGDDPAKKPKLDGDLDPDRAMRDLGKARDDAKREKELRQKAEQDQQAKLDAVLIALGLKPDPKTDPAATAAKVAKELTDAQAENRELRIENALFKLAGKACADVDALTDSRGFMKKLAELDPTASDFEKSVTAAIKDAVKDNPKLAATAPQDGQGPARQGADITGSGGGGKTRPATLGAAIAARMSSQ
jgi:hypothetical protein